MTEIFAEARNMDIEVAVDEGCTILGIDRKSLYRKIGWLGIEIGSEDGRTG